MNPNDPRTPPPFGYGAPPPPGQEPFPMTMAPPEDSEATTVFVLGIVGLVLCNVLAPVAWAKGASYQKTCRAMGRAPRGLGTAGWIMGMLGTGMLVIGLLGALLMFAAGLP